jgi:reverse gyrase
MKAKPTGQVKNTSSGAHKRGCPQCGGKVTCDTAKNQLVCEFCHHRWSLEEYPVRSNDNESD